MKINRVEHPAVRFEYDIDGRVHAVSGFGDAWCEDEDLDFDGGASGDPAHWDWCETCLTACRDEGAVIG